MTSKWRNRVGNLSLAAASLLLFGTVTEGTARLLWPAAQGESCMQEHPKLFYVPMPHCTTSAKEPEGPLVSYRYNACGHRGAVACGPKPPGTLRIAGLGDSFTEGVMVAEEDTYLVRAAAAVSEAVGGPVEVHNLGVSGYDLLQYEGRLPEALALEPDAVTVGLLPNDLFHDVSESARRRLRERGEEIGIREAITERQHEHRKGLLRRARSWMRRSRAVLALQHGLFQSPSLYAALYTLRGTTGDYLSAELSPEWEERLRSTEQVLITMAGEAQRAGTPLVVIVIPQRIQVVLLGHGNAAGLDPHLPHRRVRAMGKRGGFEVVDFLVGLESVPDPGRLYYPVDGHLTTQGQRELGAFLARALVERGLLERTTGG
jgi:hypothetical protein